MTTHKGVHRKVTIGLGSWLSQFDTDRFLAIDQKPSEFNLLDPDAQQGVLTQVLPHQSFCNPIELQHLVFWLPKEIPSGRSIHLASSRIGKRPDLKRSIFDALRTFAIGSQKRDVFLATHAGTSLYEYSCRLSELFGLTRIEFMPFPAKFDSDWFRDRLNTAQNNVCYYGVPHGRRPSADELLIRLAAETRLLSVRSGGNVAKFAIQRLASENFGEKQTYLLVDADLTSRKSIQMLQQSGTTDWWLYDDSQPIQKTIRDSTVIVTLDQFSSQNHLGDFMIHWTRPRSGPWPGQSAAQFIDDLLLGLPSTDHSRIASLCRIVASGRLLADSRLCRDHTPVVCFADVTVDEVINRRVFRSHLSRWDFEPCGIAIRKSILNLQGAKPVIYGNDKTWKNMSAIERPFFQLASSTSPNKTAIDWTQEKEHRICGNVALERLSPADAFLFVETQEEALRVAPLSRWPVIVLA